MKTLSLFLGVIIISGMTALGQGRQDVETHQQELLRTYRAEEANRRQQAQHGGLPIRPTNLKATVLPSPAGANRSFIKLSWVNNGSNTGSYELERREWPDGEYQLLASPTSNQAEYADNDVNYATTYLYRIRAKDAQGKTSAWSSHC